QDGAKPHTANISQNYSCNNQNLFISKEIWPSNSPDLNPCDCYVNEVPTDELNQIYKSGFLSISFEPNFWMNQSPDFIENKLTPTFIEHPLICVLKRRFLPFGQRDRTLEDTFRKEYGHSMDIKLIVILI
ncbi:transposable element tcb2 transposase, partial [Brachionus plicatilis]